MSASPRFWNRIAKRYARQPIADEDAYRRKLAMTREYLRADMQVLEFGCGTGGTALIHAPHVARITAIDFSDAMIAIARDKAKAAGASNVAFEVGAIEELDAPDGSFDAVLGLSVLHLVTDPAATIARVRQLLRPGGVFVSSTACIGDMPVYLRLFVAAGCALRIFPPVHRLTGEGLRGLLRSAGFTIEQDWQPGPGKALFLIARAPA